ncbi:MAG TPA: anhydro-N-acetylmuramic acid kinase [Usitatibacter sp.]|nr:anhydro-N-acetylmuramic acid kinase [Usitatibacter sp.]
MSPLFVGLMSGTSLDGADAALVDFSSGTPRTLAFATVPFSDELREQLLALSAPGRDSLDLSGRVTLELSQLYARAVEAVLAGAGVDRKAVAALGCHGQTVRHRPDLGFTIQLNDPARLAELTGIDVVADFRRRDMAAGGQGAPLVPAFHEAVFRHPTRARAVVNIGGISNVTWLPPGRKTVGFDCGPGNVLLDGWARRHLGAHYDEDGKWAARGHTDSALLERLLGEPFLGSPPPKSTGRELFRLEWLEDRLPRDYAPADVQSTLADFTARAIVDSIDRFCESTDEIYLSGGGARNAALVSRIEGLAGARPVAQTDVLGVPTAHVESMAFAWLAMKCVRREPVDLTASTGARAPRVLGAIYAA